MFFVMHTGADWQDGGMRDPCAHAVGLLSNSSQALATSFSHDTFCDCYECLFFMLFFMISKINVGKICFCIKELRLNREAGTF